MTDTFNSECPNCKITIGRIEKWIDHVNITPKKYQRYNMLVEYVTMFSKEDGTKDASMEWVKRSAINLLKEIDQ